MMDIPELQERIIETVIRNVAEGLTNIGRYAQAQKVVIDVSSEQDVLLVTVQDDGQGFDPDAIPSGHYGLLGIRERMRLLGGSLEIQSSKGSGTRLEMRFPL
jgi:signal transduction histidine kinase